MGRGSESEQNQWHPKQPHSLKLVLFEFRVPMLWGHYCRLDHIASNVFIMGRRSEGEQNQWHSKQPQSLILILFVFRVPMLWGPCYAAFTVRLAMQKATSSLLLEGQRVLITHGHMRPLSLSLALLASKVRSQVMKPSINVWYVCCFPCWLFTDRLTL